LKLDAVHWKGISLTEVRNMQDNEDIIIETIFSRTTSLKYIDKKQFIIHSQLSFY
jgi:hypothetical protein